MNNADEGIDEDRQPRRVKDAVRHVLVVSEVPISDEWKRKDERYDAEEESRDDGIGEEPPVPFVLRLELDRDGLHAKCRVGDGVRDAEGHIVDCKHVLRVDGPSDECRDDEGREHQQESAERKRQGEVKLFPSKG